MWSDVSDEQTSSERPDADGTAPRSRRELRELRERIATDQLAIVAKEGSREPGEKSHGSKQDSKQSSEQLSPPKPRPESVKGASKKRPVKARAKKPAQGSDPTSANKPTPASPSNASGLSSAGKPRFSAAAYAAAAAAMISDAAARSSKQRPGVDAVENAITAGGIASTRAAGGAHAPAPRADFTASQSGAIVSHKSSFGPPPGPDEAAPAQVALGNASSENLAPEQTALEKAVIARTGATEIARTTTGSIAKQRLTTSGAVSTITRENLNADTAARLDALTGPIELPSERRKKRRRRIGTVVLSSLLAVVVVTAALGGWGWWMITRSFPEVTGTLAVAGLKNPVTVQRDTAGVATITAESPTDLFFSQGYVHAQDRFWEMDVRRHITSGTLSEMFGVSQVGRDKFLRALGWHDVAQQEYELMTPRDRSYYDAYAAGVNAYLEARTGSKASVEYALLGISGTDYEPEPWEPVDSIAWMKAMAWDLRSNIEAETTRALLAQNVPAEQVVELYPDYPFAANPPIVAASSPVPESGFVIGATTEPEPEESDAAAGASPEPTATSAPAEANVDATLASHKVAPAASDENIVADIDKLLNAYGEGIGSNSWVVSGRLTESGKPLLANDPHLGAALPSVWTQLHLRCSELSKACPFDVSGFSFSGLPGIIIGHNQQIAWGFTNLTTDVADLYIERLNEAGEVYYDGETQPVTKRTETINVAGGNPVTFTVRETTHGPILSDFSPDFAQIAEDPYVTVGDVGAFPSTDPELPPHQSIRQANALLGEALPGEWAVALRWTALDAGTSAQAIFALNTATNFDEFRAAAKRFNVPAQNLIYADVEGNIGYQAPGQLPVRGGGDGWMPQPGWDPSFDWQGFIEFDELPVLYNPASGYIVTANNAIIDGPESTQLTRDWDYGYRQARIVQLVEQAIAAGKVTPESMAAVQNDNRMWIAPRLANAFKKVSVPSELQPIIDDLQAWDGQNSASSPDAAYANVLWNRLVLNIFHEREDPLPITNQSRLFLLVDGMLQDPASPYWQNDKLGITSMNDMLITSAEQARDELIALQGDDRTRWSWGELHALELKHETIGTNSGIAAIEWLLNRGPFPTGGGGSVVNATGWVIGEGFGTVTVPSMRMVIDLGDFDNSTWINLTGQSGHAFHANYTDQTADWASGKQRPWAYSPEAIDANTAATLTLQPK